MPLPKPGVRESESAYVSRCMGSETLVTEYPDVKQRAAVCHSQYRKAHADALKAELSHERFRSELYEALEKTYPRCYPWIVETWDSHAIVAMDTAGGNEVKLYRVNFTATGDVVALSGEPLEVEQKYLYKGKLEIAASRISVSATAGEDAEALLAELVEKNPLFASLKDSPNAHFVMLDLTSVGKISQHAGPTKYQLAKAGVAGSLPSLIGKPIHVISAKADDMIGHFIAGEEPRPIGVFLGSTVIANDDGTQTIRAIGTLWDLDFPETIEEIKANKDKLGASYEILYPATAAAAVRPGVLEIGQWEFSGGAILLKAAAAHPETQVLVAELDATLPDSDFALIQTSADHKRVRRFPIHSAGHRQASRVLIERAMAVDLSVPDFLRSQERLISRAVRDGDDWAKDYVRRPTDGEWVKREASMATSTKYAGFTAEQEAGIDKIIADALAASTTDQQVKQLRQELEAATLELATWKKKEDDPEDKKNKAHAEATAAVAAFQVQVAELTEKLTTAEAALAAEAKTRADAQVELDKLAAAKAVDDAWTKLKADYGLKDDQRDAKLPILQKVVAQQPLTLDDIKSLTGGGSLPAAVPLIAGANGDVTPDVKEISKRYPNATTVRLR